MGEVYVQPRKRLVHVYDAGRAEGRFVMLLGARQFFERRGAPPPPLPYDAEVEYLESTGTQYIDTGIYGRENLVCSCRFAANSAYRNNNFVVAADAGSSSSRFWIVTPSQGIRCAAMTSVVTVYSPLDETWHEVVMDTTTGNKKVYVDGSLVWSDASTTSGITLNSLMLFARTSGAGTPNFGHGKIGYFIIIDSSTGQELIKLFPVRFTNEQGMSEGAMYDRVSGQLFRNAGTGAFLYGPDKS